MGALGGTAQARAVKVTSTPVSFQVRNTDTTASPKCTPDGGTYTVRGHLTGPSKGKQAGVTLYLHGLGLGEWLWNFPVKRYSHARSMARSGHASVTIDRLGYGESDHPADGSALCIGAHADIAHQIVAHVKAGSYTVGAGQARKFKRVGVVGHSAAGQISITEAYTYRDLRALVIVGFSYSNLPRANDEFGFQRIACDKGGDPLPGFANYGLFGRSDAGFRSTMFHSAPRSVQDRAITLHYADPCGDNYSLIDTIQKQAANAGRVKVPVLVACGRNDVLYAPFGCEAQAERFAKGRSLILKNAGHGLPLEATAKTFRKRLGRFLGRYGL